MSHSLNYYSVVENDEAAATSPSPLLKNKFLRTYLRFGAKKLYYG